MLQKKKNLVLIKRKIVIWKIYYLLSDLAVKLQQLYEMHCANENIFDKKNVKYFLQENFEESICF